MDGHVAMEGQPMERNSMLVLERLRGQRILVGEDITVTVVRIDSDAVRLGIEAPDDVKIWREEIWDAKLKKFLRDRAEENKEVK
jgi:carbon storage regulator